MWGLFVIKTSCFEAQKMILVLEKMLKYLEAFCSYAMYIPSNIYFLTSKIHTPCLKPPSMHLKSAPDGGKMVLMIFLYE